MAGDLLQIALFCAVVTALVPLLGGYLARVFRNERVLLTRVAGPLERGLYRAMGVDVTRGQDWKAYARSVLVFSALSWGLLFLVLRAQGLHPFNHGDLHSGTWDVTFNTVSSFVTNTNWQYYAGETTLTDFSQMAGLTVQNFASAAVGLVVLIALIRGIAGRGGDGLLGNFWQDLTRAILYVLLPISIVVALVLVSQGVVQSLGTGAGFTVGPVASQEAIKLLGTNGGGFFNVNSAHPFENPGTLSNILEMVLMLAVPAALTFTYGSMVGSRRQGWAIFSGMGVLFLAGVLVVYFAERHGTPAQHLAGLTGANMEGKEQRFGTAMTSLWAVTTTATSSGAVNGAMESLTALGGALPTC